MRSAVASAAVLVAVAGLLALVGQPAPRGDAYLCYQGVPIRAPFLPAFVARPGTVVVDRFSSASPQDQHRLDVTKPVAVCNPAGVDGRDPVEPATRLEGYGPPSAGGRTSAASGALRS
jgi:hypothetical protein